MTLLIILGFFLKLIGICLAIPNTVRTCHNWKEKQKAYLYQRQFEFTRYGKKPKISSVKKIAYRIAKMPLKHLWCE